MVSYSVTKHSSWWPLRYLDRWSLLGVLAVLHGKDFVHPRRHALAELVVPLHEVTRHLDIDTLTR